MAPLYINAIWQYRHFPVVIHIYTLFEQDETAFVDPAHLRRVCEAAELPLSHQLVDATLMKWGHPLVISSSIIMHSSSWVSLCHHCMYSCQTSSSGAVDYQQFLQLINWRDHPLPTPRNTVTHPQPKPLLSPPLSLYSNILTRTYQFSCIRHTCSMVTQCGDSTLVLGWHCRN